MKAFRWLALAAALLGTTPALVFAQLQTARIQGAVIDASGQPVGAIGVVLTDPLGAEIQRATTDAAGRFSFVDVPIGRLAVRAERTGTQSASVPLVVEAAVPIEVTVRLPPSLEESIAVDATLEPSSSRVSIAGRSLDAVPIRIRGRSLQDAVATLPGWATEDNGLLHARGVDDGFLYVLDGVPVYERLDTLNGIAPDLSSAASINVVTGYVAPEFGYKAGGVIEVRSKAAADRWQGTADLGTGRYSSIDGGGTVGGAIGRHLTLRVGVSGEQSDRFLDPVHPDNLHNHGSAGSLSVAVDSRGGQRDHVKLVTSAGRSRYDVPNTDEQEEAGQDQQQEVAQGYANGSWQRVWSDRTVTHLSGYYRRGAASLEGSPSDTPLFSESERTLSRTGVVAGVSQQRGAHLFKVGVEAQALSIDETFSFFVTDEEEAEEAGLSEAALEHDADDPFAFEGEDSPTVWSFYVQDTWQAGSRLTVGAGVRFDRATLLLPRHQWSPRAGASYQVAAATVLRGSISRFFQPPQPEYLLLSSSEEARELSPFVSDDNPGGAEVEPDRQWAIEAGIEHRFPRLRLDTVVWRRDGREVADPNVFFGTTIVFPNAVAESRAYGFDIRAEVPRWRGWSGYASTTVSQVRQTGPITGGLFLEDEIASIGPGVEFVPDHDQRLALAGGASWEHAPSGFAVWTAARYESGTPIQRDEDDEAGLEDRPGAEMADFDKGRVKPRTLVSLGAAYPLARADRLEMELRGSLLNLFDDRYAFNFGNPFSGTHFGTPRTGQISLRVMWR